jgi:cytochrome c
VSWDEVLKWMVAEQEMDPLEPDQRKRVLDYLTTHYGRD